MDFEYTNENWRDQLTKVNDKTITYDKIGKPLSDGTWTFTWQNGRQLARMQSVDTDASFIYNENGLRVQKTVNGVVTKYTLHGKNVVHMTQGSNELHFFYDASNKPAIVVYNGTPYSYVKNLQGDVVAIQDANGTVVVRYVYDAWGRPINKTGTLASTLGSVQPFRYRGYVYDEGTGLYYLHSRYYNPNWFRFINVDGVFASCNLFAYCSSNPVCNLDNTGIFTQNAGTNTPEPTPAPGPTPPPLFVVWYDVPLYNQSNYNLCWAMCDIMIADFSSGISRNDEEAWNAAYTLAVDAYGSSWNDGGQPQKRVITYHRRLSLVIILAWRRFVHFLESMDRYIFIMATQAQKGWPT